MRTYSLYYYDKTEKRSLKVLETEDYNSAKENKHKLIREGKIAFIDYEDK